MYICKKIIYTMFEHKTIRNRELMSTWRESLKATFDADSYESRDALVKAVLTAGTPRYDVSYDYAVRMMYWMVRDGKPCPARGRLKKEMWEEICGHVRRTIKQRGCTIPEAVATVLAEQKASRYFLSKKQASKIIYYESHNRNLRRGAL